MTTMTTITEELDILALLPNFSQTILEEGHNGETIEHGHVRIDGAEMTARVAYAIPEDGEYDRESGEYLGNWEDHILRMEIDDE